MAGGPGGREVDRLSIRVLPDTSGFAQALQRYLDRIEQRARLQVTVTADTSGFAQRLRAALAGAARTLDVPIRPSVDRTAARQVRAYLVALTERLDAPIRPVIDRSAARRAGRDLSRALGEVRVPVRPRVDPSARTRALAQLAELGRTRTATLTVRADESPIRQVSTALRSINPASAVRGLVSLRGVLATLGAGSLPSIASLVVSLAQIGPAALVAVPGVLALASAVGALTLGTKGVGAALKAAATPAAGAAGAASTARAVAAAQRQLSDAREQLTRTTEDAAVRSVRADRDVADAEQNLADARREAADRSVDALRAVAEAERRLTDAQAKALDAQKALEAARVEAAQNLEDLADRVVSGRLDERDAVQRLADAEKDLADARTSGSADGITRAQLAYEQAAQALREQRKDLGRLEAEQARATAAGVDGAERVVSAQRDVVDAQQAIADAAQATADAHAQAARQQVDSAATVARAERDVADARQAAAEQARDSARQIADAQRAVADAQQAIADAAQKTGGAAGVDAVAEAMGKLAPNARSFVGAVREIGPAWREVQQAVQQRLFAGLDDELRLTSASLLPILRQELAATAGVLNQMGVGVAGAARELAANGTLGAALSGTTQGLRNLAGVPGQIVTSLTTIGAAAAPGLGRVTQAIAEASASWAQKLQAGLASGGLERLINQAINLAGQLVSVLSNVGRIVGNIFGPAAAAGGGFLGVLEQITAQLARVTATPEVQQALLDLFNSLALVGKIAAPLVGQALQALGPVVSALAPGFQLLVTVLGQQGLQPVITALGPVLLAAARAVSGLAAAGAPLLGLLGTLASALLPAVTPLLDGLGLIFKQTEPLVAALANALQAALGPILAQLPVLIGPFVTILTNLTGALLPVLTQLITQLPLGQFGQSFAAIAVALAPLLAQLAVLQGKVLTGLVTVLQPVINLAARLAAVFAGELAKTIEQVVVPALRLVSAVLHGDLSGAVDAAKDLLRGLVETVVRRVTDLPVAILGILRQFAVDTFEAGTKIIGGLIDGIKSKAGAVKDAVTGVLKSARDLLPFSPAREGPFSGRGWTLYSGQSISDALATGILDGQQQVYDATYAVAATAQGNLAGLAAPLGAPGARRPTMAASPAAAGLTLNIADFHAYADQSPADIGRALYRETRARG